MQACLDMLAASSCEAHGAKLSEPSGMEAVERWLGFWGGLQLGALHAYPVWEAELHAVLRPHFDDLCRLYVYYCNAAPQTEADLAPPPPEEQALRSRMTQAAA